MNTIIERLSQIEERSVAAAAEGTEKKKELTAQYEERTRQFDRELDQETEERIRKLREQADAAANARIQSQEKEAAQSSSSWNATMTPSTKTMWTGCSGK